MSLQNKYVWAEFYPGFMDVNRPLKYSTQYVDIPYYLYAPRLFGNSHYSGTTPYKLNEIANREHYLPYNRKLDYLDLMERPLNTIPHRRSMFARLTNGIYYS